jgi:GNAT superfamily N-acetyltransferase
MRTIAEPEEVKRLIKMLRTYEKHHVTAEAGLYLFYGATFTFMFDGELPVSFTATKFNTKVRTKWTPYAIRYGSYTRPDYRRRGLAKEMFAASVEQALALGCVRIKSLAGSAAELALHRSVGNHCWGLTPNNEVRMDTPLPGKESLFAYNEVPPDVPQQVRMSDAELVAQIQKGLRYDHKK